MNAYEHRERIELTDGTHLLHYSARDTHGSTVSNYTHMNKAGDILDFFNTTHATCHGIRKLLDMRKDTE